MRVRHKVFVLLNGLLGGHINRDRLGRELGELHDVASERARLVREDVLDLTQLFVDVGRLSLHVEVLVLIVHKGKLTW